MNTQNFKSDINTAACQMEDSMRAICKVGRATTTAEDVNLYPPLTAQELQIMQALLATEGRGDGVPDPEREKRLNDLIQRYVKNGGVDPRLPVSDDQSGGTSSGSFATRSIDNIPDLINFIKASAVILLGSSFHPSFLIPANMIVFASFIYAVKHHIQKFIFKIKYT